MSKPLIIGFGNRARQGKDMCAEAIKDYYERKFTIFNLWTNKDTVMIKVGIFKFATALYQEVNEYLKAHSVGHVGMWQNFAPARDVLIPEWVQPDPNPEISELVPYGKHPKLLQFWGTEYRRAQDPDYWTKKLFASIPSDLDIALITDVRFPNEAAGVKERGGYLINVQRLRDDSSPYFSSDRASDHPSETALDNYNWDFYIKNKEGYQALTAELAITHAEYLRAPGLGK